jgi:nucleotide-binding universal stress UspA family protein
MRASRRMWVAQEIQALEGDAEGRKDVLKKLLVGLDGSPIAETAVPYAETIAKATGGTITLLKAIGPVEENEPLREERAHLAPVTAVMPAGPPHAAEEKARNARYHAQNYLDSILTRLGNHGVPGEVAVVPGDPASVIVDEARARNSDLILLATHGRSGLGRLIFGSVAEAVLAKSPVPVFLARAWTGGHVAEFGEAGAPILVALDGTPESERVLPLAKDVARALSKGISLVEIVPAITQVPLAEGSWVQEIPADVQVREEEMASDYLTTVAGRLRADGIPVVATVRTDTIGAGIAAAASDSNASLIVMATHAPTGITRALVGSVALEVLHRGGWPVLLVGPAAR